MLRKHFKIQIGEFWDKYNSLCDLLLFIVTSLPSEVLISRFGVAGFGCSPAYLVSHTTQRHKGLRICSFIASKNYLNAMCGFRVIN